MVAALIVVALAGPQLAGAHHELFAAEATASSFVVSNWHNFRENQHPSYVLDGDAKTAWVEGKDGNGEGEWVRVETTHLKSARQLKLDVRNGCQKSASQFTANAMPAEIDVVALGPALEETARKRFTLEQKLGWQPLLLDLPADRAFGGFEVRVATTHDGRVHQDGCISDIRIFVDSDVKYDAAFEHKKRMALLAWTKDRQRAAAYFKKVPKEYPFSSTQMRIANEVSANASMDADSADPEGALKAKKLIDDDVFDMTTPLAILAGTTTAKTVRLAKIGASRAPEGGPVELELLLPFVDTSSFALLESAKRGEVKAARAAWSASHGVKRTTSHARADGTLAGLCFESSEESDDDPDAASETQETCVAFDETGKATAMARTVAAEHASEAMVLRIERDENGKISGVDMHVRKDVDGTTSVRRARFSTVTDTNF